MENMIRVTPSHFRGGPRQGMLLEGYYIYGDLRMKISVRFRKFDRNFFDEAKWKSVLNEILTRSGYSFRMTREQFININIKSELFPGVEIKTNLEGF